MKSVLIILLSLLTAITALGQAFEGQIMYSNSYKSKLPNVTDQQWGDMMGVTQEYYIKGGAYRTISNGNLLQWQLYNKDEAKLYTKMSNSESALWNDVSINSDEILKTELKKNAAVILGYKCDELTLTGKNSVQKYYFNSKLGIDSKVFANHQYGNWYTYLKSSNAVPLKMIYDSPQFLMECVATSVKPMKLEDKFFALPAGLKTEKSPY